MSKKLTFRVGVVGATGLVGDSILDLLESRNFSVSSLKVFASKNNINKKILWKKKQYKILSLSKKNLENLDFVFFSAGSKLSQLWSPVAKKNGAWVIDNSSAFRNNKNTALIVPEANSACLDVSKKAIIANPNCSTIQLISAIYPLEKKIGIKSIQVASYQSISGAGTKQLLNLLKDSYQFTKKLVLSKNFLNIRLKDIVFSKKQNSYFNLTPCIGKVHANNFSEEEEKIKQESKKILQNAKLKISAFAVRVPTLNTHSEAVWLELNKNITLSRFISLLKENKNTKIIKNNMALNHLAHQKPHVFISRIRKNPDNPCSWLLWITSDNILKGAALNAVQIAEYIAKAL